MELRLDSFGRIVIPKDARTRLGLSAGDKLDAEVDDERIVLKPRRRTGKLVRIEGVLVWQGSSPVTDVEKLIPNQRDARARHLLGGE